VLKLPPICQSRLKNIRPMKPLPRKPRVKWALYWCISPGDQASDTVKVYQMGEEGGLVSSKFGGGLISWTTPASLVRGMVKKFVIKEESSSVFVKQGCFSLTFLLNVRNHCS